MGKYKQSANRSGMRKKSRSMKDFSLSLHTEPSIPQVQVSHPRSVDPGLETQQVTSPQTSLEDGAGAMLKPAPATKSTWLFFVMHVIWHMLEVCTFDVGSGGEHWIYSIVFLGEGEES